jgi:hypothetical protein
MHPFKPYSRLADVWAPCSLFHKKRGGARGKYQRMPSTGEEDAIWTRTSISQRPRSYELPEQRGEQRGEQTPTSAPTREHEPGNRVLRSEETMDTYVVPTLGYSDS